MTMAFRSSVCCHNTQYKIIIQNHLIINLQCKFIITIKCHKWSNTIKINKLPIGKWVIIFQWYCFISIITSLTKKILWTHKYVGELTILPIFKVYMIHSSSVWYGWLVQIGSGWQEKMGKMNMFRRSFDRHHHHQHQDETIYPRLFKYWCGFFQFTVIFAVWKKCANSNIHSN